MPKGNEYCELHAHSYFSLLDGASLPEALVEQAKRLGLSALALTDHDSLAGAVRFATAAKRSDIHAIFGAEVTLESGRHLTLLAETAQGYANLSRVITASRLAPRHGEDATVWQGKREPLVTWSLLEAHRAGLIALSGCPQGVIAAPLQQGEPDKARSALTQLLDIFGKAHCFIELQRHALPAEERLNRNLLDLAYEFALPIVATGNVHYATQAESLLRDVLIATRHNQSLTAARKAGRLPLNSNFSLASPSEMVRRFADLPQAIRHSQEIAERCQVRLDFTEQRLPKFPSPDGRSEFATLYELCHQQLPHRYPDLTPQVLKQLAHELDVIQQANLAGYFLIVWDIVRFAREQGIRCQGRGSAANSIVAYLLRISSIDPLRHHLLFERFLSADRYTMPDIDIDFAADRREEVIQYVRQRYGDEHTAMVCNVVTYQARMALRDIGKALELPDAVLERLVKGLDTNSCKEAAEKIEFGVRNAECGITADNAERRENNSAFRTPHSALATLLRQIDGCPRHLSIHSGGMVLTAPPLAEIVPLEPATMEERVVMQWDKDSVEDAGLIKIDLLSLRTLGVISEALRHIEVLEGKAPDLDTLPLDDPAIYQMLAQADTIGTFQVESRAQQQMLPRLKPTCFEDITIEVAIVRPGPIQGGAVHPYLRRRAGLEPITYPHPSLEPVLKETLGVLLFQEQAIRVAVAAAGFSPGEADMLRRALSRKNSAEAMQQMEQRFLLGATRQGIDETTAKTIFSQLAGFAGYGFPKSHAASFALIAYQTLWLKCYYPAAFYCSLFNAQPMGFYSTEVLAGDAKRHGIPILPPDIHLSHWRYTLERTDTGALALRMGLATVHGLGEESWQRIETARAQGIFSDLRDVAERTQLPKDSLTHLIRAGIFDSFGERRPLLWQLGEIDDSPNPLSLHSPAVPVTLPALPALEQTLWEHELLGLSPPNQLLTHYRPHLRQQGILSIWQVKEQPAGKRIRVGGMVVVRQRPATANGILFMSLEDESGLLDLVVKPDVYTQFREVLRHELLIIVEGMVQKSSGAVNVVVMNAVAIEG